MKKRAEGRHHPVTDQKKCLRCSRILIPRKAWTPMSKAERDEVRKTHAAVGGRGLCSGCYTSHYQSGDLIDFERTNTSAEIVLDEWRAFARLDLSIQENARRIAPEIGMTEEALARAIYRSKRKAA